MKWLVVFLFVRTVFSASHNPDENPNLDLFEGDLLLTPKQRYEAEHGRDIFGSGNKRGASTFPLWPNGILVYTIDNNLAQNAGARAAIAAGMDEWTTKTCIRFRQRVNNEPAYVLFTTGRGCSSSVARTGSQQRLSLDPGCRTKGIVAHEIGHALGLFHEQSRPDRDDFVEILFQNIRDDRKNNFVKQSVLRINSLGRPYDYRSVMHYGDKFFTKNGQPTIRVKRAGVVIGQREGLSAEDAIQANLLYQSQCDARPTTPRPTPDVNECLTSPCDANAVCQNTDGSFTCTCNAGYNGDGLSCTDINECLTSPCDANAVCQNTIGSFTCTCNAGFTGDGQSCTDINECLSAPCDDDANAVCQNTIGSFTCTCKVGFTGDGLSCTDINECLSSPCDVNANCQNIIGSFQCTCNAGFTGDGLSCLSNCRDLLASCESLSSVWCQFQPELCNRTCGRCAPPSTSSPAPPSTSSPAPTTPDVNECLSSPCDVNAVCQNTDGSFTCTCNAGFTGDGLSCTDINECLSSPCDANAVCQNTDGSFTCTCNAGFTGDGLSCTDINECLSSPCDANAVCQNTDGSFTCTCNAGFTGDGLSCTDINECLSSPCDVNANCQNIIGSFQCTCNAGFTGDGITCSDINECLSSPCDVNAVCQNTDGSFTCTCNAGFTGDGLSCTDINECLSTPCDANAICQNTDGSFTCTCNAGFTGDGLSCISNCRDDLPSCVSLSSIWCQFQPDLCKRTCGVCAQPSTSTPAPPSTSTPAPTTPDVNECLSSPCDVNAVCQNTDGSFTCTCNAGFTGDGLTCTDINECLSSPCDANAACQNTDGSFTCTCNAGFTGDGLSCTDIDECLSSPCAVNANCQNIIGSFQCTCNAGFTGDGITCSVICQDDLPSCISLSAIWCQFSPTVCRRTCGLCTPVMPL